MKKSLFPTKIIIKYNQVLNQNQLLKVVLYQRRTNVVNCIIKGNLKIKKTSVASVNQKTFVRERRNNLEVTILGASKTI